MFEELETINARPEPFEFCTVAELWTDEYISKQMLACHLNGVIDLASRKTAFIDRSAEWIASRFNVGVGTKIADFGCGPGLYTTRLAKKQADVTGIDFSTRSIQYAAEVACNEKLSIHYVNRNYLEYETDDRFDLILMIYCDFSVLSPAQRRKMLSKFHTFLKPGGYILLDVCSLNAFEKREESAVYETNPKNGFWSPDKCYVLINTFKYETEKVVVDKYTIVEADRTRTIYTWLQHYSPEALGSEFAECGFKVENFYSDVAGTPFNSKSEEFAVVTRRM